MTSNEQGSSPACSSRIRRAMVLICSALTRWKAHLLISASMSLMSSSAISAGVRARTNNARAMARLVSSRVRTEIRQATRISKAEVWPASKSWNSIARGNGLITSRTRSMATSMSNGRFVVCNRGQSFQVDPADDALYVGLFDGQVVQRIERGDFSNELGGSCFQTIELQPAPRAVSADLVRTADL